MRLLQSCLIVLFIIIPILSHSGSKTFERLLEKNDEIDSLSNYKDSEDVIKLKLKNLKIINKSRKRFGLKRVKLDILASRVANKHCVEMVKYKYMGHWNKKGHKPYHRYAFAGGRDHIGENLASKYYSGELDKSSKGLLKHMKEGHDAFMAEIAPNDGHKKMVLVPEHSHIGIGYAISDHEFRYAQEFVDRFVRLKKLPKVISSGDTITLKGKVFKKKKKYGPYAVIVHYEPKPRSYNYKNQPGSYLDGASGRSFILISPWNIKYNRSKRSFKIKLKFKNARPGYYYIVLHLRDNIDTIPYVLKGSVSMSTRGTVPVTGIVVEVRR